MVYCPHCKRPATDKRHSYRLCKRMKQHKRKYRGIRPVKTH